MQAPLALGCGAFFRSQPHAGVRGQKPPACAERSFGFDFDIQVSVKIFGTSGRLRESIGSRGRVHLWW